MGVVAGVRMEDGALPTSLRVTWGQRGGGGRWRVLVLRSNMPVI